MHENRHIDVYKSNAQVYVPLICYSLSSTLKTLLFHLSSTMHDRSCSMNRHTWHWKLLRCHGRSYITCMSIDDIQFLGRRCIDIYAFMHECMSLFFFFFPAHVCLWLFESWPYIASCKRFLAILGHNFIHNSRFY